MTENNLNLLDFSAVAAACLNAAERLVPQWLPLGKKVNGEWVAPNPTRSDKAAGSFSVNLRKGVWKDFSSGEGGADLIALYAYIFYKTQAEACRELQSSLGMAQPVASSTPSASPAKGGKEDAWALLAPVPADSPPAPVAHYVRGAPEAIYCYRDQQGAVLSYIYRFITSSGGKEFAPLSLWRNQQSGAVEWKWRQIPALRPLYGLPDLAAKPTAWVLLVEGEKCRDVAAALLPELVVLTWSGGSNGFAKCDFSALAGRTVILWPDADAKREKLSKDEVAAGVDPHSKPLLNFADQPGNKAMHLIAADLVGLGCGVRLVDLPAPGVLPDGWDIADAIEVDGWDAERVKAFMKKGLYTLPLACAEPEPDLQPALAEGRVETALEVAGIGWLDDLIVNPKTGLYKPQLYNVHLILLHDAAWRGVLAYNLFAKRIEKLKPPPYFGGEVGAWSDVDTTRTLMWLQKRYELDLKDPSVVDRAVLAVGMDRAYHPVRDYLDALKWDGIERLGHFFSDVFGSTESYAGEAGKNFMVAAVARIYQPGCKVDEMIVLEGAQGIQKSTVIRTLFSPRFYLEQSEDPSSKDFYLCLQGKWGIEIGEMNSFRNAKDWTEVKLAISRRTDKFRAPYDRHPIEQDRECVFLGTTNEDEWLSDPTGGRRFIPIKALHFGELALLDANRDQYWAEAVALYRNDHRWWHYSDDVIEELDFERHARQLSDSWIEPIVRWLDGHAKESDYAGMVGPINKVSVYQLLTAAIGFAPDKITAQHEQRVGKVMRRLKWLKKRGSSPGDKTRPWVFVRPDT